MGLTIHQQIIEILENKGGKNFTRLNILDLYRIFTITDSYYFNSCISIFLSKFDINLNLKISVINTTVIPLEIAYIKTQKKSIEVSFFKERLGRLFKPNSNRVVTMVVLMRRICIFILLVYVYNLNDIDKYGFDKKFNELYKSYYKLKPSHLSSIKNSVGFEFSNRPEKINFNGGGLLSWSNNSCYIDSLLIVLFYADGISKYFLEAVKTDRTPTEFGLYNVADKKIFKIKLSTAILQIYNTLAIDRKNVTCMPIREILLEEDKHAKRKGSWVNYNPSIMYNIITDTFPSLKLIYPPIERERTAMFTLTDYMNITSSLDVSENVKTKDVWNKYDNDFLVLENINPTYIKDYTSTKDETVKIVQKMPHGDKIINDVRRKDRALDIKMSIGKFIYSLVGCISVSGAGEGEDASHYISFFRMNGIYYKYNNLGLHTSIVDRPIEILQSTGASKTYLPILLFYFKDEI